MSDHNTNGNDATHEALARLLADAGREFYGRGWALGTSGNFSAVASRDPLRLAITASGLDKGALSPAQILEIDGRGQVTRGEGRPSDETRLHLSVVRARGAGAVLHTHSVWSTLLSEAFAAEGRLVIEGFEMLKGLAGVRTHEHRERSPSSTTRRTWTRSRARSKRRSSATPRRTASCSAATASTRGAATSPRHAATSRFSSSCSKSSDGKKER